MPRGVVLDVFNLMTLNPNFSKEYKLFVHFLNYKLRHDYIPNCL